MIRVLIQVGAGSPVKNLYNERTLELRETRHVSHPYPYPYGFIVGTSAEDGDAVDCYLITKDKIETGSMVDCEPIGLLEQFEGEEIDHKVLAALPGQLVELTPELLKELQEFIYSVFTQYPEIKIHVGPIQAKEAALRHIHGHQKK